MKNLSLIVLAALFLAACSMERNAPFLEDQFDKAISFNDEQTAILYLHELRAIQPENNSIYTRMADLYSKTGNYSAALKAADLALEKANELESKDLLFLKYRAFKANRDNSMAIQTLDTLSTLDKERYLEYQYEIAVLYFEMKDIQKANQQMLKVLNDPMATQNKKILASDLGQDEVSYQQAAINFIAYLKLLTGELENAETMYIDLLQSAPGFKLAKSNYQLLIQQKNQKSKENSK